MMYVEIHVDISEEPVDVVVQCNLCSGLELSRGPKLDATDVAVIVETHMRETWNEHLKHERFLR